MPISMPGRRDGPPIVMQFYHSLTFPYLMEKHQAEIQRRLADVPKSLRKRELLPALEPLGETSGDVAWQVFRTYLDRIEDRIADIVRGAQGFGVHCPEFE